MPYGLYGLNPRKKGGAEVVPSVEFLRALTGAAGSTATFADVDIGPADQNRLVVICVSANIQNNKLVDYVKVNGRPCTLVQNAQYYPANSEGQIATWAFIEAPTGRKVTIDAALDVKSFQSIRVAIYRVVGPKPKPTEQIIAASGSVSIPAPGGRLALWSFVAANSGGGAPNPTDIGSNLTVDHNLYALSAGCSLCGRFIDPSVPTSIGATQTSARSYRGLVWK